MKDNGRMVKREAWKTIKMLMVQWGEEKVGGEKIIRKIGGNIGSSERWKHKIEK